MINEQDQITASVLQDYCSTLSDEMPILGLDNAFKIARHHVEFRARGIKELNDIWPTVQEYMLAYVKIALIIESHESGHEPEIVGYEWAGGRSMDDETNQYEMGLFFVKIQAIIK